MPYIKFPTFKFGRNPSLRDAYDLSNLTGTQKLTLTASRIFGFRIGGNLRGGNKILRNKLMGAKRLSIFDIPLWDMTQAVPYFNFTEKKLYLQDLNEKRKLRVLMRGIKIGRKKGGARVSLMNVFEKKSDTQAQKAAEKSDK